MILHIYLLHLELIFLFFNSNDPTTMPWPLNKGSVRNIGAFDLKILPYYYDTKYY